MFEVARGFQFITAVLTGDAQAMAAAPGGVWRGLAPDGTAAPYFVISHQGGGDILTVNARRMGSSELFQIVAFAPASQYPALVTCADRIDALFGRTANTPTTAGGVTILAGYREQELALDELVGGILWSRAGGLHRLVLSPT